MPRPDKNHPLPECTPGLMQMAFPDVFRSGDADPYQCRPVSIRQPKTVWRQNYLHWVSRQPEAEGNVELQFVANNQLSRDRSGLEAKLALRIGEFPNGLPTKEELQNDPELCQRLANNLLCFQSKIEDSDAFWRAKKHDMIGVIRDIEDPPSWRHDDTPLDVMLWQTRAVAYNHHPAIHRLCDNAAKSETLPDDLYLNARFANTLRHPGIVSWVSIFIGELDTLALARVRYAATHHIMRAEWGANGNPHVHRHIISEPFSRFLVELKNKLMTDALGIEQDLRRDDPKLEKDVSRNAAETRIMAAWRECQLIYMKRVKQLYTNWNAGLTKDGHRTFDFGYDRKHTL